MYVYNYKVGGWTFEKTKWFFEKTENATHPPELTSSRFGSTIAHISQGSRVKGREGVVRGGRWGGWIFEKTNWFFEKTQNATHPPELTSSWFGSTIAHISQIVYGMTNMIDKCLFSFHVSYSNYRHFT
jgi:hypothetical protein